MDAGIWATWYDLDDATSASYLDWLHEIYLPYLERQPGFAWVAHYENRGGGHAMQDLGRMVSRPGDDDVPKGGQYLLLVGAPSAHTFFAPTGPEKGMPEAFKARLAQRQRLARAVFSEVARVTGPAIGTRPEGTAPAPAIQMGAFRIKTPDDEFELAEWYARYRLPSMAAMPGCVATRKLISVAGWPKHAILYEFDSLESRLEHFEKPHEALALDPSEWTGKVVRTTIHMPGSPVVGQRTWPRTA